MGLKRGGRRGFLQESRREGRTGVSRRRQGYGGQDGPGYNGRARNREVRILSADYQAGV